jgi:hypothetical protein
MYFIKYLVGVFRKQPFESDWNYETLSFFDPVAQDKIGFNLQQSICNKNLHAIDNSNQINSEVDPHRSKVMTGSSQTESTNEESNRPASETWQHLSKAQAWIEPPGRMKP